MKSPERIRATLSNRLNADCSTEEVKNNRYHYLFRFEQSNGWDWIEQQVYKSEKSLGIDLELWEIHPSGIQDFEIEVREVERREGIDNSQSGLDDFER